MSSSSVQLLDSEQAPGSQEILYGIFKHDTQNNSATSPGATAVTWDQAYRIMTCLIEMNVNKNPQWGSTNEVVSDNMLQIIGSSGEICLCYEIDAIVRTGADAANKPTYTRLKEYNAPVHYVLFFDLNIDQPDQTQSFFVGGYKSLSEAEHGMTASASAYLKKNKGTMVLGDHSVQLLGVNSKVRREYRVEKGRFMQGTFVTEEDWRNEKNDSFTRKPVLHLPMPTTQATSPASQHPSSTQAAPSQQPNDGVAAKEDQLWCYCDQPDDGTTMLECQNKHCETKWFHLRCTGLSREPPRKEKWWCDDCKPGIAIPKKVNKVKGKHQA